jgi:pullulanase
VGPNGLSDVRLGVPITLTCADGTGNLRMNAPSTGNYTFALNAASTANPVLTVSKTPAFSVPIYVRGVGTDWSDPPTAVQRMTPAADANLYRAVLNVATAGADADGGFKIADAGWTAGTNCGSSTPLTIGQPLTLACTSPGNDNIGVTWPSTGLYLFALDTTNPAAPQLTVEKVPVNVPVFVRGIGGDWTDAAANQMSYFGGGIWSLNKAVAATANEFKVASSDWATVDCGAGTAGDTVTVGTPLAIGCNSGNGNLKLTPAREGTYTFKYRRDTPTAGEVTVSGP